MISFIKRLFTPNAWNTMDNHVTIIDPVKMSLDERMEWRHSMVHKSVQSVFASVGISKSAYRYRTLPIDNRAHYFVIMADISSQIVFTNRLKSLKLSEISKMVSTHAFENYGITIESIYWKSNDATESFGKFLLPQLPIQEKINSELRANFSDSLKTKITKIKDDSAKYDPLSYDEAIAFRDAIIQGKKPPPLTVGDKEYDTDIAPLGPQ